MGALGRPVGPPSSEKGRRAHARMLRAGFELGSSSLLGRPSGGVTEYFGARQVSWLAAYRRRRLPGPVIRSSGAKRRRHAAHSRGGGHGSAKRLPCSLFTLGQDRGTVHNLCSSFAGACQMRGRSRSTFGRLDPRTLLTRTNAAATLPPPTTMAARAQANRIMATSRFAPSRSTYSTSLSTTAICRSPR